MRFSVVAMPRAARPLFEGDGPACSDFIHRQTSPNMTRLGLVVSAARPDDRPDVVVCVPAAAFDDWEVQAAKALAAWEEKWLLIESAPRRHRDEARADLHHAIASALLTAAMAGVDAKGAPIDDDF